MSVSALTVMKVVLVVTVGVGVSGGLLAWRERPEPGALPLVALLAGQSWWSATLFFQVTANGIGAKTFWVDVSWLGIAVIPVAWLLFSLEYTGYSRYIRPKYVALLSIVPVVTAALGLTDSYHDLLYVNSTLVERGGARILNRTPGVWFWVITGYTYLLGLLGSIPLLRFVTSDVDTFRGQSLAILVGIFVPWVTNSLFVADVLPTAGIDPTPVAFSVSGIAYLGALTYFQLLGTAPAPIRKARLTVFERMQEGAIVLDRHDHVVDMNEQAVRALGAGRSEVLGCLLGEAFPNLAEVIGKRPRSGQTDFRPDDGGSAYDVSISQLVDVHGREVGRILTLHDISGYLRQQQRLEVLNRVFRHNIRNNMQVIIGTVEHMIEHSSEVEGRAVLENAREIDEISDKIREVLDLFEQERGPTRPRPLGSLLRKAVTPVRNECPEVSIHGEFGPEGVYVDRALQPVFSNVVENAAEHNTSDDPRVRIEAEEAPDGERVRVVVEDNGPGIDDQELALVEEGTETPLRHGSGFGLAVIVWGTEITGGTVSFEEGDPTGLKVTIDIPAFPASEYAGAAPERADQESTRRRAARE
ncbi:MAG: histidine kinase N-terminal 7TM domain-containing protein [Salinirussus sp.]